MAQQSLLNTNPAELRILRTNEQVTSIPAAEMLRQALALPTDKGTPQPFETVLDNACGAGVVTAQLFKPEFATDTLTRVVAADVDPKMTSFVSDRATKEENRSWAGKVETMQFNQQDMPLPDGTFSHVFSNFGVFFSLDDEKTLAETLRVLRPGGLAGFTTWKTISWVEELVVPALRKFIPDAPELPNMQNLFPDRGWSDRARSKGRLASAGFVDAVAEEFDFVTDISGLEFAESTTVLLKTVVAGKWSAEDNEKYAGGIQDALERYIEENHGGRLNREMTAIISLGRKP